MQKISSLVVRVLESSILGNLVVDLRGGERLGEGLCIFVLVVESGSSSSSSFSVCGDVDLVCTILYVVWFLGCGASTGC